MNEVNRNKKANRLKTKKHDIKFSICLVWSDYERSESERKSKQIENATHNSKSFQGGWFEVTMNEVNRNEKANRLKTQIQKYSVSHMPTLLILKSFIPKPP